MFPDRIARWLCDKAGTAFLEVPSCNRRSDGKLDLGHGSSKQVPLFVGNTLEGDRKVEPPPRRQTVTDRNDARVRPLAANADRPFVRMGREETRSPGR
jgi:hypothetical protein